MPTYCTPDDIRDALRLTGLVTFDETRIARAAEVATARIDAFLDRPAELPLPTPAPALVVQSCINLGVKAYRRPGAPYGASGFTDADGIVTVTDDDLIGERPALLAYKARWGIS